MDITTDSWDTLQKVTTDKYKWREWVLTLKKVVCLTARKDQKTKTVDTTITHRVHKQRFTSRVCQQQHVKHNSR